LPRAGSTEDESLGSFVRRRLGNEVLERIAEPLIAGIHAAEPESMSLAASFPRFLEMEAEHRSLILAARRSASRFSFNGRSHFSSFRLGMSQLTTALAGEIDNRVEVRTNSSVTALERSGRAGYLASLEDGTRIAASAVVVATPAPAAAGLLERLAPDAARKLSEISQVGTTAVTLAYQSGQLPDLHGSGFVVPSTHGLRIRGVSYLSRKWEGRVPHSGFELVRVFFGAGRTVPQPVESARQELASTVGITVAPDRVWVRAHPHGLHRYTIGHLERVTSVERSLTSCPGITVAGAGLYGVGLNECVLSGRQAADLALDAAGLPTVGSGSNSR
jgi:protoporphyrinogen/coproporphyrinogen III oxidase